jgi:hypothetical protein
VACDGVLVPGRLQNQRCVEPSEELARPFLRSAQDALYTAGDTSEPRAEPDLEGPESTLVLERGDTSGERQWQVP